MAHFKKAFPGKYLQTADLDVPVVATISSVSTETVGAGGEAEEKLVVRFADAGMKALVLNLTKCEAIAEIARSEETDEWKGVRIEVSRGMTMFQGRKVACIVVTAPPQKPHGATRKATSNPASDDEDPGF